MARILIACEYSGRVREAFAKLGHEAMSCDLEPTDIEGQHYQGDVLDIINDGWDMMIAFPPCTYLASSGNAWLKKPGRLELREQAFDFVMKLYNSDIKYIAIENPVGYLNTKFRKPDQIVQPYHFGEHQRKSICLWLKNLPLLQATDIVQPEYILQKTGGKIGEKRYFVDRLSSRHKKRRNLTFQSVANQMAIQWGKVL